MERRAFITAVCSTALAWPMTARAQRADEPRKIGILTNLGADDPEGRKRVAAFTDGLRSFGWADHRNVTINTRWAAGDPESIRKYAAELIGLGSNVILATGSATVTPLLRATTTIPIVFVNVPDPVGSGVVASLARPGGNATGFTPYEYSTSGKWLELLKEIAPSVRHVAVVRDPAEPAGRGQFRVIEEVGPSVGRARPAIDVHDPPEIERGLARSPNRMRA